MAKIKTGYCGICDTMEISSISRRGEIVPNQNYCEICLALSNKTICRHAICAECSKQLTDEKINSLFSRIKETWLDSMVGWASEAQFKEFESLQVVGWVGEPDDKKIELKVEEFKVKEHKDMLKKAKEEKNKIK